jgi:hypothetical protein
MGNMFVKNNLKMKLLIFFCLGLVTSCNSITEHKNLSSTQSGQEKWNCISTFDDFIYQMVRIEREDKRFNLPSVYPSSPWELTGEIPKAVITNTSTILELVRNHFGQTELWIRSDQNMVKHNIDSNDFSIIPFSPYDDEGDFYEDVEVRDLFESATGNVMGVNYPRYYNTVWQVEIPLLSIYNEDENRFEFYNIGLNFRDQQVRFGSDGMIPREGVIVTNRNGIIWIYQQQDGLYSYNPINYELRHYETKFDGVVQRMIAAPEGYLLFSQKTDDSLVLSPGELVKYYPSSHTVDAISVPLFRWPDYGTLVYTNSGDMWIGFQGFLSKDGTWVSKNPNRFDYFNLGYSSQTYNWHQPELLFQSSNGYLWYTNSRGDGLGVNGSAWYDPVSETGCWFTTESANIVEDEKKNLWMVVGAKIFKLPFSHYKS